MNLSKFFIDRPIFAGVLSVLIFVAGLLALRVMPISEYPGSRAAPGDRARDLSRRLAEGDRGDRRDADRGADQRRRGHALYVQPGDHRRRDDADGDLQARHRSRQGAAARAEPRLAGRAAPARGGALARHHHGEVVAQLHPGRASDLAERPLRHQLSAQLRRAERQGPAGADFRRRPDRHLRRRRLLHAHLARSAEDRRARPVGLRRRERDPRAERPGRGRHRRRLADPRRRQSPAHGQRARAARERGRVRQHRHQDRRERRGHPAARRRPHRARRGRLCAALAAEQQGGGRHRRVPGARLQCAGDRRQRPRDHGRDQEDHAGRRGLRHRL